MKRMILFSVMLISCQLLFAQKKKIKKSRTAPAVKTLSVEAVKQADCIELTIIAPADGTDFSSKQSTPTFSWKTNTKEKVKTKFELFEQSKEGQEGEKVFETITTQHRVDWPKKVQVGELAEGQQKRYLWKVSLVNPNKGKNCKGMDQASFSFSNDRFDIHADSITIDCEMPAYNAQGQICYQVMEYWTVTNNHSAAANFSSHNLKSYNGTSWSNQSGTAPSPAIPASVAANSNISFSYGYDICIPIGEQVLESELSYIVPGAMSSPANEKQTVPLPDCICDPCDQWELISVNNQVAQPWVVSGAAEDYIYIEDLLTAVPLSGQVVQVNAEIVKYEHWNQSATDECLTCNTLNTQHGVFMEYANPPVQTNTLQNGFANNNRAAYTGNGWTPSREAYWVANNPGGTNVNGLRSRLTIGVPKFSALRNCCTDLFKICIRYTFTALDLNGSCIKCSELVCYEVKRNAANIILK